MAEADAAMVYYSQHALELKKLPPLDPESVKEAFGGKVKVFTDSKQMIAEIKQTKWDNTNLLMMSSGNFDGIDFNKLANELL